MEKKTNWWAISGLIGAFVMPVAGLVLSIIGLKEAEKDNGNGHTMAKAGLILSIVTLVIAVVVLSAVLITGCVASKEAAETAKNINDLANGMLDKVPQA